MDEGTWGASYIGLEGAHYYGEVVVASLGPFSASILDI